MAVRVGVGCFLFNSKGEFIVGIRKGSHGSGSIQLPGGHLEIGESFERCAMREVEEETGISVAREEQIKFVTATNDVFSVEGEGKHYVTIFVACRVEDDVEPKLEAFLTLLYPPKQSPPLKSALKQTRMPSIGDQRGGQGNSTPSRPSRSTKDAKRVSYKEDQDDWDDGEESEEERGRGGSRKGGNLGFDEEDEEDEEEEDQETSARLQKLLQSMSNKSVKVSAATQAKMKEEMEGILNQAQQDCSNLIETRTARMNEFIAGLGLDDTTNYQGSINPDNFTHWIAYQRQTNESLALNVDEYLVQSKAQTDRLVRNAKLKLDNRARLAKRTKKKLERVKNVVVEERREMALSHLKEGKGESRHLKRALRS